MRHLFDLCSVAILTKKGSDNNRPSLSIGSRFPAFGEAPGGVKCGHRHGAEACQRSQNNLGGQAVELAVKGKADQLDGMRERVELAQPIEPDIGLPDLPQGIQSGRHEKHREDDEIHHTGEILKLGFIYF